MLMRRQARDPFGSGLGIWVPRVSLLLALWLPQCVMALALAAEHRYALVDDAFISFRYAERWAEGNGWTWQDDARVEGFSNPLWTYLLGALARIGVPPYRAALPLGIVIALAATTCVIGTLRRMGAGTPLIGLVAGGMALDVGLAVWSGSGLETAAAALLVALLIERSLAPLSRWRDGIWLGVYGALLVLVRPEGFLWWGWTAAWLIWGAWASSRVLAGFALGSSVALFPLVGRVRNTGSFFSNTFFAKLEPSFLGWDDALGTLWFWLLAHAVWIMAVLSLFLAFRKSARGVYPYRWALLPAGLLLAEGLFVVVAGGDWMGRTRYLVPVLPAFYLLAASVLVARQIRPWPWLIGAALAAHVAVGWIWRDRIPTYTVEGKLLGRWLAAQASPGDTLATTASGAIPYFSRLPTLDVLGLNDAQVRFRAPRHRGAWAPGHHRYDIEDLLNRAPEWIVWDFGVAVNKRRMLTYRNATPDEVSQLDYRRELYAYGKFHALYQVETRAPLATQRAYTVFRRRE